MEINNGADLKDAIRELEVRKLREKTELEARFHGLAESLKPMNLIKSTISKVKETPGMGGNILKATAGLGVALLSKRLLMGSPSTSIVKRLLGSAVKMGVAGLVAKNSDKIKAGAGHFLKNLFSTNKV